MTSGRVLLQLNDARVSRSGRDILHISQFTLREGEHVAVLGPNGAGKSTLVGLLTRDIQPLWADPPPVLFLGEPRTELSEARRLIGVVSSAWQEIVDVGLPVREVVLGGRFGSLGVPRHLRPKVTAEDERACDRALAEIGIADFASRDMRTLSTGEARRALIARALVLDPRVLVLDEPCAGLDPAAALYVRDAMRVLADAGDRTLLLVTHHIEDVVRPVERVVFLANASIVADGARDEMLTSSRLSELFGVELSVEERDGEYRLW